MKLPAGFENRDLVWNLVILGTAGAALLATGIGLLLGFTTAIPHLLYIPVIIAAYQFPRRGTLIATVIGGIYLIAVFLLFGITSITFFEALLRTLVIIAIGWLIATLTIRLREQENLYQGLFDHSEVGSILIADAGNNRIIEEINWRGMDLLHRKGSEIRGEPIAKIWSGNEAEDFFNRLAREGAVYATQTTFSLPEERSCIVVVSAATLPGKRAILSFLDITSRVHAETALKNANDKLSLLSRFSTDHLHRSVDEILDTVDEADARSTEPGTHSYLDRIRTMAWNIARQLFLTESYKDLGVLPLEWINVRQALDGARLPPHEGISIRIWTGRLEVYADPLFADVLTHLLENSLRYNNGGVRNIVVTYHETPDGLDLCFKDDGAGIPADKKEEIFSYDAGGHAGIGLFICRQIAEVTGFSIREIGSPGAGALFVVHIPMGMYRIEGTSDDAPAMPVTTVPVQIPTILGKGVLVRELLAQEFPLAEAIWTDYHNTKGDQRTDRIVAAFHNGEVVSVARCRRHSDGLEVDGVFTPVSQRGHGYAQAVVAGLIEACGQETLYMHSVWDLAGFYGTFGFVPIDEKELPPTIRERFAWAGGEMEGANVRPMKRVVPDS